MEGIKRTAKDFNDCTSQIIGCAMRVHSALSNGFQEVIYQRALAIEMRDAGLGYSREMEMPIFYKDEPIGTRRVDFFVESEIMVELKAIIDLSDAQLAQGMNYLEAYNMKIGLLINFGSKSLQFKRLLNRKHKIGDLKKTNSGHSLNSSSDNNYEHQNFQTHTKHRSAGKHRKHRYRPDYPSEVFKGHYP